MEVIDYVQARDHLCDGLAAAGLEFATEETISLNNQVRTCEVYASLPDVDRDIWAKISFEWTSENQALWEAVGGWQFLTLEELQKARYSGAELTLHCEFHLHLNSIALSSTAIQRTAIMMKREAELVFGDEGGVIAEVLLSSEEARLECLRFEHDTTVSMVIEEPWWVLWCKALHKMLAGMRRICAGVREEFGLY